MSLYSKMTMPDLQRYPGNLNLINNMRDTVVFFLTRKVFISVTFSSASYEQEMRRILSIETAIENKQFKKNQKH